MTLLVGLEVLARSLPSKIEVASLKVFGMKGFDKSIIGVGAALDMVDLVVEAATEVEVDFVVEGTVIEGRLGSDTSKPGSGITAAFDTATTVAIEYFENNILKMNERRLGFGSEHKDDRRTGDEREGMVM